MHEHVFLLLSILQKSPFVNLFLENPPNFGYKHNFTPVRLVKRQKRIFFINAPKKVASIRIFCYPCRESGQGFAGGFLQEKKPPSWLWPSRLHHAACGSCCADAEARVPSTYRSICFSRIGKLAAPVSRITLWNSIGEKASPSCSSARSRRRENRSAPRT